MANALIFYHITRVRSIELATRPAGYIALSMIAASVLLMVVAVSIYAARSTSAAAELPPGDRRMERTFIGVTLAFFAFMCLVVALVGFVIIRGSLQALQVSTA